MPDTESALKLSLILETSIEWLLTGKTTNENFSEDEKEIIHCYKQATPAIQEAVPAGIPPTVEIQATMEAVLKMAEAPISVGTIQVITEARTIVEIIPETTETQAIAETIPEIMKIQGTMETIPAAMKNRETAEMIPEMRKLRRQKLLL